MECKSCCYNGRKSDLKIVSGAVDTLKSWELSMK